MTIRKALIALAVAAAMLVGFPAGASACGFESVGSPCRTADDWSHAAGDVVCDGLGFN